MFLKCNPNDLYIFSTLVDMGGFTAVANALNIPKSRISRRISALETELDARLIQRTTRTINLTEAGHALYQHCKAMIASAHAGEDAVRNKQSAPAGLVRISVPIAVGHFVVSRIIPQFLEEFPKVRVEVNVSNQRVDMIAESYDMVIRGVDEAINDSSLVQVSICKPDWVFVASPKFIDQFGFPDHPHDLQTEHLLIYSKSQVPPPTVSITGANGEAVVIKSTPRLISNSFLMLKSGALGGIGVAGLPPYMCYAEIESGSLNVVMPHWIPRLGEIIGMFPTRRGLAPATRALLDFIKRELPRSALVTPKAAKVSGHTKTFKNA